MKFFKIALVAVILLVNCLIAQPSLANTPNFTTGSDYAEVTQAIDNLLQAKETPDKSKSKPEELERQLGELNLQKYILETARNQAQCRNETGKTLAIYAHKPKKENQETALYFLGNGEITEHKWDCDGIYLPAGANLAGQELAEPVALKVVDGTQLVAKANPTTGAIEFNVAPAKIFKADEVNWSIPNLSQAEIEASVPNAPIED